MERQIKPTALLKAFFVCLFLMIFALPSHALEGFNPGETASFETAEEVVYNVTRAKTVSFGAFDWKITDASGFGTGEDGLSTSGVVSLMKRNPVTASKGFQIEIIYSTSSEDMQADPGTAFFITSTSGFGTAIPMIGPATTLGIAENGDVYIKGEKINHAKGGAEEDVLTAKSALIAPGEECHLVIRYAEEELSVYLTHGEKTAVLVDHYPSGALMGLRELQLGGDNNTTKRIKNAVYRSVSFSLYEEYVPQNGESLAAVLRSGDEIREYTDMERALLDAKESAHTHKRTVLKLYRDLTLDHPLEIGSGWDFSLDLNGFTVDRGQAGSMKSDGYVITVLEGAKLKIEDSSPERTHGSGIVCGGIITGGAGSSVGGGILLNDNASLTMKGGSVMGCVTDDHGGAIRVLGDGVKISISGAGFYGNRTYESSDNCHGGAIYGDRDCEISVSDTVFEGNYAEDNGGAIYMNSGRLRAADCIFSGNRSGDDGGAVYLESGSYATMDVCRFYQNGADGAGGAVYCNSSEGTRVTGKLLGNTAGGDGGAICVDGDAVCLADAEIRGNRAAGDGSGVYVDEMVDLNVQGLLFVKENVSTKNVKDDIFLDNTIYAAAHIYDGGLYDGSEVWIRADDRGHKVIENVSEYQAAFFKSDVADMKISFKEDKSKPEFYTLVTSAVGEGSIAFIAVCGILIAAFIAFLIIDRRKKKKGAERD